jgi:hypothetical protein
VVVKRNPKKEKEVEKRLKPFKTKWIYESLGITKQAYSQRLKREKEKEVAEFNNSLNEIYQLKKLT